MEKEEIPEWRTWSQENITCPHCGFVYEDSWEFELDQDDLEEFECGNDDECGKTFFVKMDVEVTYSSQKSL